MRTKSAQPIKTDYADKIRKENPMNAVHQSLFFYQPRQTRTVSYTHLTLPTN